MLRSLLSITMIMFCFLLTACAPCEPRNSCDGMRNELNSRIVFNAATGNDREAGLQRAQKPLDVRSYDQMTNCRTCY